jgi:hypothetical protein
MVAQNRRVQHSVLYQESQNMKCILGLYHPEPEIPQQGKRNVLHKQIMNNWFDGKSMLRPKKYSQVQMPENTSHEKFNIDKVLLNSTAAATMQRESPSLSTHNPNTSSI